MAERCRYPGMQGGQAGACGEVRMDGAEVDYRRNVVLNKGQPCCRGPLAEVAWGPRRSAIGRPPIGTHWKAMPGSDGLGMSAAAR